MAGEISGHCWHCGQGLTRLDYGRELCCPGCGKPTRCCRNCRHFAPGRPNECREPMVERVIAKEQGNFCEWFEPLLRSGEPLAPGDDQGALRRAAEDLFK